MQGLRTVVLIVMAFILLWPASRAAAQSPTQTSPPVWTDILTNTVANTGVMNMASGNYFAFSDPASSSITVPGTDLGGISPNANTVALAPNLTTLAPANTYTQPTFTCGSGASAAVLPETQVSFIESFSSAGSGGIFGIGFEGTFNSPSNAVSNINSIFEAVFFNENQCYGKDGLGGGDGPNANGREYGFFLDTFNNTVWAYWGALENVSTAQVQVELTTCSKGPGGCTCDSSSGCTAPSGSGTATSVGCSSGISSCSLGTNMQTAANGAASPVVGTEYFYEIYPFMTNAASPGNCSFQINIFSSNNTVTPIYTATIPVNGGPTANTTGITGIVTTSTPITDQNGVKGADDQFCNVIASTSGDVGFASANVNPGGATTGSGVTLPSPSELNLNIQRLFVGKE